ncbi:hypothetical protein [Nocardia sp. CC227C]|uniref:hypothetical protein n=1 Tax=Nocardia sp. CC227C TaxID=3044562 RepID=UPI00278BD8D1|nr:hypothetical protein [Nocardia sp. CC227C]
MVALAADTDVETQLGRSLTTAEQDKVGDVLAKASDLFRREAEQDFTPGESTVRLKVEGGRVRLPQAPATEVTAVVDDDGADIDHELSGQWLTVTRDGTPMVSHEFVTVTYSHGGAVPDLVRITIAEIAAKVLRAPAQAQAGIVTQQRSAGGFQETNTYAAWALGGGTTLSPEDRAVARSFRYRGTKVIVCQP